MPSRARPAPHDEKPGDVRGRGGDDYSRILTLYYLFTDPSSFVYNAAIFLWLLPRCSSPASPRRWRKRGAELRPSLCRRPRTDTPARKLVNSREEVVSSSADLRKGDRFVVEAGEIIPADGEIVEGIASVDRSAITRRVGAC